MYSEITGIQVRISEELHKDGEIFIQRYAVKDHSWLKDFSRIEIFNEHTGKNEIILLKSHPWESPEEPNLETATTRIQTKTRLSPTPAPSRFPRIKSFANVGKDLSLSREKLQKLIKGPYRSPLPVGLYEDPEYQAFFTQLGVKSVAQLQNKKQAKKIRKAARRMLHQMKAKAK